MASDETDATNTIIGIIFGVLLLLILLCAVSCCLRGKRRRIAVDVEKARLGGGRQPRQPRPSGPSGCPGGGRFVRFNEPIIQSPEHPDRPIEPRPPLPPVYINPQTQANVPSKYGLGQSETFYPDGPIPSPNVPEQYHGENHNGQRPVFATGEAGVDVPQGPNNQGYFIPSYPQQEQTAGIVGQPDNRHNVDGPDFILEQVKVCPEQQRHIQAQMMQRNQDVSLV